MSAPVREAWSFAQYDDVDSLQKLVPSQVDPNSSTYSRENHIHTLLMSAAVHGSVRCAEYLLENGASVDRHNFLGWSALHWTAYGERIEVVDLLLKKEADIETQTEDGKTCVHIAASRGHLQYLNHIIGKGADLNAITSIGWSAVFFAVTGNFRKVAEFLVRK
jgi:ankyrin repeat protein